MPHHGVDRVIAEDGSLRLVRSMVLVRRGRSRVVDNPALVILGSFVVLILAGTVALSLPLAADAEHPGVFEALFLATSAVTVTGLITFNIDDLSTFGEVIVLALIQVGGFGIMTIGTVVGIVTARRLGVRQRVLTRTEIGSIDLGEVRSLVGAILRITIAIEVLAALILAAALIIVHGRTIPAGLYEGAFLSISAFNNAGLTTTQEGLEPFGDDPTIIGVISIAIILGGLGFPVIIELSRRVRPIRWSLHTKLVIAATGMLLVVGPLVMVLFEWTNPATLGPMDTADKLLAAWFQGVTPRTAGFATVDMAGLNPPTQLVMIMLMFVGAGPASTGGGIRITTFACSASYSGRWCEATARPRRSGAGSPTPSCARRSASSCCRSAPWWGRRSACSRSPISI